VPLTPQNIYGELSLVFWTLTVVSREVRGADPAGRQQREGGLIAMLALASAGGEGPAGPAQAAADVGIFGRRSSSAMAYHAGHHGAGRDRGPGGRAPGLHHYIVPLSLVF
jgi:KUP system potassium uptake protein